ncbi:aldehyde dehydrogenase [Labrys miyagiensis]
MTIAVRLDKARLSAALDSVPQTHELFIDGRFSASASGKTIERLSPGHGVRVATYAEAGAADLERALAAARKAFDHGPWPTMTGAERSRLLHKVADLVEEKLDVFANS